MLICIFSQGTILKSVLIMLRFAFLCQITMDMDFPQPLLGVQYAVGSYEIKKIKNTVEPRYIAPDQEM